MSLISYKGVTTKTVYRFSIGNPNTLPAAAVGTSGSPLVIFSYNGENVILVNNDGSIRRGDAGTPDPNHLYDAAASFSTWEQQ